MGIWSANGDIGNITGFLAATIIINQINARWEFAMLFAAVFNMTMAISVFLLLKSNPK